MFACLAIALPKAPRNRTGEKIEKDLGFISSKANELEKILEESGFEKRARYSILVKATFSLHLVWLMFLTVYQSLMGYLMPKFDTNNLHSYIASSISNTNNLNTVVWHQMV